MVSFNYNKICTFEHSISLVYINCYYFTVFLGIDVILHLHSFQDNNRLASFYDITFFYLNIQDNAGQRRLGSTLALCFHRTAYYRFAT